ncbi:MAG: hypothetical protein VX633_04425, partial [Verrucomicrobiota bacterium]|nr:hypothetical protein [Verrucomicrobiota bacterium]
PAEPEAPEEGATNTTEEPAPTGTPKQPAPPSVVAFTAELREKGILKLLNKLEDAEEGGGRENPLEMMRDLNELSEKMDSVDIEALPEDLKNPVHRFRNATADMAAHMEEMPIPVEVLEGGQEAIGPWFVEKMAEDPLFTQVMQDWGQTMQEVGGEMEESGEAIEGAFEKYGIDPSAE